MVSSSTRSKASPPEARIVSVELVALGDEVALLLVEGLGLLEGARVHGASPCRGAGAVMSSSIFFAAGGVSMRRMRRRLPASSMRSMALSGKKRSEM